MLIIAFVKYMFHGAADSSSIESRVGRGWEGVLKKQTAILKFVEFWSYVSKGYSWSSPFFTTFFLL